MPLTLTTHPNPILRKKGASVKEFGPELKRLAAEMIETMIEYHGVGLAAQQIGQALQLAVIDITGIEDRPSSMSIAGKTVDPVAYMPLYLINPQVEGTKAKDSGIEGCLSFPGLRFEVPRSRRVKVTTQDLDGKNLTFEAGGLLGVAIQHEFDHLQGKLFVDYLTTAERQAIKEKLAAIERGEAIHDKDLDEED